MKLLKKYLPLASVVFASSAFADGGVSVSYRSSTVIIEKNWVNDNDSSSKRANYDGVGIRRTLNMVSIGLFFDDSLRGHDETTQGQYITKYFIRVFEQPSDRYPVGRFIEKEVEIGEGASADDVNIQNQQVWNHSRVPKVYSKRVHVIPKVKGSLPGWLNPNRGAGYIFGLNFNYAAEDELVEYYSGDMYIGKRLFILPQIAHMYFKIGPSIARYNYNFVERSLHTEIRIGGFYAMGFQTQVLKGIKFFAETEFRGYSPAPLDGSTNLENSKLDFVNVLPPFSKNYKDNKFDKEWFRDLITQGIRFGMKFTF